MIYIYNFQIDDFFFNNFFLYINRIFCIPSKRIIHNRFDMQLFPNSNNHKKNPILGLENKKYNKENKDNNEKNDSNKLFKGLLISKNENI